MTQAILEKRTAHWNATTLVEEMAYCLGLPLDYIHDLAERVTGQSWDDLDTQHAEVMVEFLAETLHRTFARSGVSGNQEQSSIAHLPYRTLAKSTLRRHEA